MTPEQGIIYFMGIGALAIGGLIMTIAWGFGMWVNNRAMMLMCSMSASCIPAPDPDGDAHAEVRRKALFGEQ